MMKKSSWACFLLFLGVMALSMTSCDKAEEMSNANSNTNVADGSSNTKTVCVRVMHYVFIEVGPNGEVYYIEFYAFDYIDTDNGIEIHTIRVTEGFVNGVKTNIHVYSPQDKDNPIAGKYTIMNADNEYVYGSYDENDFMGHGEQIGGVQ